MKKAFLLLFTAAAVWSCGESENKNTGEKQTANADASQHPDYKKGFELVAKSDCFTCHKVSDKLVGPSYIEVANKYAGQDNMIDTMAHRIIKGSSGIWGQAVMTPHADLDLDEARAMVKYILTLNQ